MTRRRQNGGARDRGAPVITDRSSLLRDVRVAAPALAVLATCAGCGSRSSAVSTDGTSADRVAGLWWLLFWISVVVAAVVFGILAWIVVRRRGAGVEVRPGSGQRFVVVMGIVLPALVLTGVYVVGVRDMKALGVGGAKPADTVQVVGHKWWWEVRYPGTGIVDANVIHIPVGRDVRIELTTADVNHSFWVPGLAPKTDLVAGRTNQMRLHADRPGTYHGRCAEFCGLQHANMAFVVVAQPSDQYDAWAARASSPPTSPSTAEAQRGLSVLESASCATCHTVRGTTAHGEVGPDLTHVASRRTLGAGAVPNTPGHLAGWIADSQSIKPGNGMPAQPLSPADLHALVTYLETLE